MEWKMETRTLSVPKSTPATMDIRKGSNWQAWRPALRVTRDPPAQVAGSGFLHGAGDLRHVGGYVVLETVLADVAEEVLKIRDLDDSGAAEGIERVVSEFALADVAIDGAFHV